MRQFVLLVCLILPLTRSAARAQEIATKTDLWSPEKARLRGANIWQKAVFRPEAPFEFRKWETTYSPENLAKLKDWKANVINISHAGLFHTHRNGPKYEPVPECEKNLRTLIQTARANQMFVVISFRTGPGRTEEVFKGEKDCANPLAFLFEFRKDQKTLTDRARAAQNAWAEMWRETAKQFQRESNVIGYHLMCEPLTVWEQASPNPAPERDPALLPQQTEAWYAFAKELAAAIRLVDKETPILVGPAQYNAALELPSFPYRDFEKFAPFVVCAHQYTPSEYAESAETCYGGKQKKALNAAFCAIDCFKGQPAVGPLFIGEFGVVRYAGAVNKPDSYLFLADELCLIEARNLNHALWLWEAEGVNYDQFNFRFGIKQTNKKDVGEDDPLVKAIRNNWRKNSVFATPERLGRLSPRP